MASIGSTLEKTISRHWNFASAQNQSLSSPAEAAELALRVFKAASQSPMPFMLIGPNRICDQSDLTANFGYISASSDDGAIFADKPWTLLGNDAFMLGAISVQKPFHLVLSGQLAKRHLWNPKLDCATILGREIAILKAAGYRCKSTAYEIVFIPPEQPRQIKFSTLLKPIDDSFETLDEFLTSKSTDDYKEDLHV